MYENTKTNEKFNVNFKNHAAGNGGLLTSLETAKLLHISERTLWGYSAPRGDLPAVHIGRAVRYDPVDLSAWIDGKKAGCCDEN